MYFCEGSDALWEGRMGCSWDLSMAGGGILHPPADDDEELEEQQCLPEAGTLPHTLCQPLAQHLQHFSWQHWDL